NPQTLNLLLSLYSNPTATTEMYTLSVHDALPIYADLEDYSEDNTICDVTYKNGDKQLVVSYSYDEHVKLNTNEITAYEYKTENGDRKSTRLNSSHVSISYAVFCLKKKKKNNNKNQ